MRQLTTSILICLGLTNAACILPADTLTSIGQGRGDDSGQIQYPGEAWHSFQPDLPVSMPPFNSMHVNWKQRIDQPYVFVDYVGSYTETGRLLPMIHRAMVEQGIEPSGPPFALFYDDPGVTPVDQLRSRACVPVDDRYEPSGSLSFEVLPSTTVTYAFAGGAYPEVPRCYSGLYQFMERSGWVENGPIRETYLVSPDSVESFDDLITEVQIPVTFAR